jgi:putative transcriptional regulator
MEKRKKILEVVHKTARGLRDAGLMEPKTMREFDVLCLPRVKKYTARNKGGRGLKD